LLTDVGIGGFGAIDTIGKQEAQTAKQQFKLCQENQSVLKGIKELNI